MLAPKEASMSPQIQETHLPQGYSLEARHVCQPRADERPLLRDSRGRVMAIVERWMPDDDAVN
jgi:hypothetical protein